MPSFDEEEAWTPPRRTDTKMDDSARLHNDGAKQSSRITDPKESDHYDEEEGFGDDDENMEGGFGSDDDEFMRMLEGAETFDEMFADDDVVEERLSAMDDKNFSILAQLEEKLQEVSMAASQHHRHGEEDDDDQGAEERELPMASKSRNQLLATIRDVSRKSLGSSFASHSTNNAAKQIAMKWRKKSFQKKQQEAQEAASFAMFVLESLKTDDSAKNAAKLLPLLANYTRRNAAVIPIILPEGLMDTLLQFYGKHFVVRLALSTTTATSAAEEEDDGDESNVAQLGSSMSPESKNLAIQKVPRAQLNDRIVNAVGSIFVQVEHCAPAAITDVVLASLFRRYWKAIVKARDRAALSSSSTSAGGIGGGTLDPSTLEGREESCIDFGATCLGSTMFLSKDAPPPSESDWIPAMVQLLSFSNPLLLLSEAVLTVFSEIVVDVATTVQGEARASLLKELLTASSPSALSPSSSLSAAVGGGGGIPQQHSANSSLMLLSLSRELATISLVTRCVDQAFNAALEKAEASSHEDDAEAAAVTPITKDVLLRVASFGKTLTARVVQLLCHDLLPKELLQLAAPKSAPSPEATSPSTIHAVANRWRRASQDSLNSTPPAQQMSVPEITLTNEEAKISVPEQTFAPSPRKISQRRGVSQPNSLAEVSPSRSVLGRSLTSSPTTTSSSPFASLKEQYAGLWTSFGAMMDVLSYHDTTQETKEISSILSAPERVDLVRTVGVAVVQWFDMLLLTSTTTTRGSELQSTATVDGRMVHTVLPLIGENTLSRLANTLLRLLVATKDADGAASPELLLAMGGPELASVALSFTRVLSATLLHRQQRHLNAASGGVQSFHHNLDAWTMLSLTYLELTVGSSLSTVSGSTRDNHFPLEQLNSSLTALAVQLVDAVTANRSRSGSNDSSSKFAPPALQSRRSLSSIVRWQIPSATDNALLVPNVTLLRYLSLWQSLCSVKLSNTVATKAGSTREGDQLFSILHLAGQLASRTTASDEAAHRADQDEQIWNRLVAFTLPYLSSSEDHHHQHQDSTGAVSAPSAAAGGASSTAAVSVATSMELVWAAWCRQWQEAVAAQNNAPSLLHGLWKMHTVLMAQQAAAANGNVLPQNSVAVFLLAAEALVKTAASSSSKGDSPVTDLVPTSTLWYRCDFSVWLEAGQIAVIPGLSSLAVAVPVTVTNTILRLVYAAVSSGEPSIQLSADDLNSLVELVTTHKTGLLDLSAAQRDVSSERSGVLVAVKTISATIREKWFAHRKSHPHPSEEQSVAPPWGADEDLLDPTTAKSIVTQFLSFADQLHAQIDQLPADGETDGLRNYYTSDVTTLYRAVARFVLACPSLRGEVDVFDSLLSAFSASTSSLTDGWISVSLALFEAMWSGKEPQNDKISWLAEQAVQGLASVRKTIAVRDDEITLQGALGVWEGVVRAAAKKEEAEMEAQRQKKEEEVEPPKPSEQSNDEPHSDALEPPPLEPQEASSPMLAASMGSGSTRSKDPCGETIPNLASTEILTPPAPEAVSEANHFNNDNEREEGNNRTELPAPPPGSSNDDDAIDEPTAAAPNSPHLPDSTHNESETVTTEVRRVEVAAPVEQSATAEEKCSSETKQTQQQQAQGEQSPATPPPDSPPAVEDHIAPQAVHDKDERSLSPIERSAAQSDSGHRSPKDEMHNHNETNPTEDRRQVVTPIAAADNATTRDSSAHTPPQEEPPQQQRHTEEDEAEEEQLADKNARKEEDDPHNKTEESPSAAAVHQERESPKGASQRPTKAAPVSSVPPSSQKKDSSVTSSPSADLSDFESRPQVYELLQSATTYLIHLQENVRRTMRNEAERREDNNKEEDDEQGTSTSIQRDMQTTQRALFEQLSQLQCALVSERVEEVFLRSRLANLQHELHDTEDSLATQRREWLEACEQNQSIHDTMRGSQQQLESLKRELASRRTELSSINTDIEIAQLRLEGINGMRRSEGSATPQGSAVDGPSGAPPLSLSGIRGTSPHSDSLVAPMGRTTAQANRGGEELETVSKALSLRKWQLGEASSQLRNAQGELQIVNATLEKQKKELNKVERALQDVDPERFFTDLERATYLFEFRTTSDTNPNGSEMGSHRQQKISDRYRVAIAAAVERNSYERLKEAGASLVLERSLFEKEKAFYDKELALSYELVWEKQHKLEELVRHLGEVSADGEMYHQLQKEHGHLQTEHRALQDMLDARDAKLMSAKQQPSQQGPHPHHHRPSSAQRNSVRTESTSTSNCPTPTAEPLPAGPQQQPPPQSPPSSHHPQPHTDKELHQLEFAIRTTHTRLLRLQKELRRKSKEHEEAVLEAVVERQRTKHEILTHKSDLHGMTWAHQRMKRLEHEKEQFAENAAHSHRRMREAMAEKKRSIEAMILEMKAAEQQMIEKVTSLELELDTCRQRNTELAGDTRRKDMIIGQLTNKLDLLRGGQQQQQQHGSPSRGNSYVSSKANASQGNRTVARASSAMLVASPASSPTATTHNNNNDGGKQQTDKRSDPQLKSFFAWKDMRRRRQQ